MRGLVARKNSLQAGDSRGAFARKFVVCFSHLTLLCFHPLDSRDRGRTRPLVRRDPDDAGRGLAGKERAVRVRSERWSSTVLWSDVVQNQVSRYQSLICSSEANRPKFHLVLSPLLSSSPSDQDARHSSKTARTTPLSRPRKPTASTTTTSSRQTTILLASSLATGR